MPILTMSNIPNMPQKDNDLEPTKSFDGEPTKKIGSVAVANINNTLPGVGVSPGVAANTGVTPNLTNPNSPGNLGNPGVNKYVGAIFQKRYKIIKELGRGGIGIVYLAEDLQVLSKPVVIKVLIEDHADEWLQNKFRQEIEALARINHPNVITVLDTGKTIDDKPFLVMQYIEGVNLRTVIKDKGIELEKVANIVQQLGSALRATHDKGIFHRDLKPENIMLQKSSQEEIVKLIDFGIAKVLNSKEAESTKAKLFVGTFAYMSPEQLTGGKITAVSDIYSLGLIAYELLTGDKPFIVEEAENLAAMVVSLILKREQSVFVKPRELRPEIPLEAQKVLLRALLPKEEDRYQQADEFATELAKALRPSDNKENIDKVVSQTDTNSKKTLSFSTKVLAVSSILVLLVVSFLALSRVFREQPIINQASNTVSASTTSSNTVFENELSYYLILQRYRDGKPFKTPLRLEKEIIFQPYDRIKIFLTSQKTGHLYIFGESPLNENASTKETNWNWNILFPVMGDNVSKIEANKELQIPEKQEFFFDKESGMEKLWLIWSERPIAELEDLTKWNNSKSKSAIADKDDVATLEKFINENNKNKPLVEKDEESKKNTTIKSNEKIVVYRLDLRHE